MLYGLRGILTFFSLCIVIGGLIESCAVLTGFPFGHYYFTDVMGPKIFVVPVFLGLAYVGMGYLSWTLAGVVLGDLPKPLTGSRMVTLPLLAALVMVAWDLCMDPIWATVVRAWIWQQGGAYFGVPLSNFFGWYLTVYIIYQVFALYLRKRAINLGPLPSGYLPFCSMGFPPSETCFCSFEGRKFRRSRTLPAKCGRSAVLSRLAPSRRSSRWASSRFWPG
jgi:uncharacterized membrane protein